jgi:hypothetical protein
MTAIASLPLIPAFAGVDVSSRVNFFFQPKLTPLSLAFWTLSMIGGYLFSKFFSHVWPHEPKFFL